MLVYGAADSTLTSVTWSVATATDNCALDTLYSDIQIGAFLPLGSTTVTYVAIDAAGNSDTCSFNIAVVDTVSPVYSNCPADTLLSNLTDSCGAFVIWTPPTFEDNSGNVIVTSTHQPGDYFNVGVTTVYTIGIDSAGNADTCAFDITVADVQKPYVHSYASMNITLDSNGLYTLSAAQVDSASWDNCGILNRYLSDSIFNCGDVPLVSTWLVIEDIYGNKDSASVDVHVTLPSMAILDVDSVITDALCFGDSSAMATLTVSGGTAPYTYAWSDGTQGNTLSNVPAGYYWYLVTDSNSCTTTDTLYLGQPDALKVNSIKQLYLGVYHVTTNGGSDGGLTTIVQGGTAPYSYNWNNGQYFTADLDSIPAGPYELVVTDSNGCSVVFNDTLIEPTVLVASAICTDLVYCPDDSSGAAIGTAIGAIPPYTYSWSTNDTVQFVDSIPYGIYTLTVTDYYGATATDTVLIDALDYDCDGIPNVDEGGTPNGGGGDGDIDGDGIPNEEDEDSDGDGLSDEEEFDYNNDGEGFDDCDGDGIPNFLDPDPCELLIPAVFTPNGDGDNDFWEILGIGMYNENLVKVFNRWGEVVFEAENYQNEFDGRPNVNIPLAEGDGVLPTGTYYYMVSIYETGDTYTGYVFITK